MFRFIVTVNVPRMTLFTYLFNRYKSWLFIMIYQKHLQKYLQKLLDFQTKCWYPVAMASYLSDHELASTAMLSRLNRLIPRTFQLTYVFISNPAEYVFFLRQWSNIVILIRLGMFFLSPGCKSWWPEIRSSFFVSVCLCLLLSHYII